MKLRKKQKDSAEKKLAQEQYPKVKTFSKAYNFSPVPDQAPAVETGYNSPFLPDERPYPTTVVPKSSLGKISDSPDFNDPERIDLQDTILTDESFVERSPKHRPPEKTPVAKAASEESEELKETLDSDSSEESYETREPETSEIPEKSDTPEKSLSESEDDYSESEDDRFEPFFLPEPEAEFESDPFYNPEEDPESLAESKKDEGPALETEERPDPFFETVTDSEESFSWFGSDKDNEKDKDDKVSLKFKKKKYTVKLKKKTDLKKKLRSRPKGSLKWKSSDEKIAKVSRKGVLKPKKKGKITVRVKTEDGEKAKVRIRVKKAKKQNTLPWESFVTNKKGFF